MIWCANQLWRSVVIPPLQILIAAGLYTLYSYIIFRLILLFWDGTGFQKLLSVGLYLLLTLTLFFFMRSLIYVLLPLIGIHFSRRTQPVELPLFHFHMAVRYLVANLLAGLSFWWRYAGLTKRHNNQLNRDLEIFRARLLDMQYTSHFLRSVFVTSFGKMMIAGTPKNQRIKRDVMQFLAYLMRIEGMGQPQPLDLELDELHCFIRLLRFHYGENAVCYQERIAGQHDWTIPAGVLFFPLENCLKHGKINPDNPVELQLTADGSGINLCCKNCWSPRHAGISSETGFTLLEAKLRQVDYKSSVEKLLRDDIFTVQIKLDFDKRI
ncbi:MAG: hypothetical protein LBJ04_19345 [Sphingobacterium sp.]|nr:hypothetical protein [Sphingobacterium sp.]